MYKRVGFVLVPRSLSSVVSPPLRELHSGSPVTQTENTASQLRVFLLELVTSVSTHVFDRKLQVTDNQANE